MDRRGGAIMKLRKRAYLKAKVHNLAGDLDDRRSTAASDGGAVRTS
jgi:hypothetical protein